MESTERIHNLQWYIPFQTGRQAGGEQLFDPLASPSSPGAKEQAKDTKLPSFQPLPISHSATPTMIPCLSISACMLQSSLASCYTDLESGRMLAHACSHAHWREREREREREMTFTVD
jgi:hypothetical protein